MSSDLRVGWPRILATAAVCGLLLTGLLYFTSCIPEPDAACLFACEQAREECRGSPLTVEPETQEARERDSLICMPAEWECREGC